MYGKSGRLFFCSSLLLGVAAYSAGAATTVVTIVDFNFQPSSVTVGVGDTVTWTNNGPSTHTSTSDNGVWDSGNLSVNQSFSHTFDTAGTFGYHCTIHPFMTASVTVSSSSNTGAPSITSALSASGTVGAAFNYTITASGATPITFTASNLPGGLSLTGATISGTPTAAGTTTVGLGASNSAGSDNKNLTLTIAASGAADISGNWTGKTQAKVFSQTAGTKSSAVSVATTAAFTQSGAMLSATVTANESFFLMGQIGNGNFWLSGQNSDGSRSLVISGHVLGKKGTSIKAAGITYTNGEAGELTIVLKRPK